MSEDHSKYQKKLYNSSRKKLQEAELQDNGIGALNLAYAQSWILISFFEIIHGYFHKAWLSSSRAVRLVQMMKLHRLDTAVKKPLDTNLQVIQVPKDLTEAEERRRIFWAAFLMDRYSCISMGWPMLIDERDASYSTDSFGERVTDTGPRSVLFCLRPTRLSQARLRSILCSSPKLKPCQSHETYPLLHAKSFWHPCVVVKSMRSRDPNRVSLRIRVFATLG